MAQYYTPFLAQAGREVGGAIRDRRQQGRKDELKQLAGSAYMGDPTAMQNLMSLNPQMGMQVQQALQKRKATTEQQGLQKRTSFTEEYNDLMMNAAKFPTFEESKGFADARIADIRQRYPEIMTQVGEDEVWDESDWQEAKTLHGEAPGGAYAGSSMDAQVSNMLTKGVEDEEFRNSPEYARAWQLAKEPKVIRTPTGDILLRPELPSVFKSPGEAKTEKQQVKDIKAAVKSDIEIIPGTEKETKTTADEKVSFGYYGRMKAAEENIRGLGDFDSAGVWERFKGLTNITASPELQQYRQAADDWIRAKLRRESGAVIAVEEMDKEYQIYFPQIGDSQAVMDQKKTARGQAERSMEIASGKEFKKSQKPKVMSDSDYEARKKALGL